MPESIQCQAAELYALGKELVGAGTSLRFEVRGWSMYPFVKAGDVIEVAPAILDDVGVGDVVLFRSGERLLVHRVVGHVLDGQELHLRVRGDRFLYADPPVSRADFVGRVDLIHRKQRLIRLNGGLNRTMGMLVARNRLAHRCVRWVARNMLRCAALGQKHFGAGVAQPDQT